MALWARTTLPMATPLPHTHMHTQEQAQAQAQVHTHTHVHAQAHTRLDATFLSFCSQYYQQLVGTAIYGSPVFVIVANMVMEEIEERARALTPFSPPPCFRKRYVDNICTVLPRLLVTEFHDHLNSINSSIRFTFEEEKEVSLPFLDVFVQRQTDGTMLN